jgi:hypothetical protein
VPGIVARVTHTVFGIMLETMIRSHDVAVLRFMAVLVSGACTGFNRSMTCEMIVPFHARLVE